MFDIVQNVTAQWDHFSLYRISHLTINALAISRWATRRMELESRLGQVKMSVVASCRTSHSAILWLAMLTILLSLIRFVARLYYKLCLKRHPSVIWPAHLSVLSSLLTRLSKISFSESELSSLSLFFIQYFDTLWLASLAYLLGLPWLLWTVLLMDAAPISRLMTWIWGNLFLP